MSSVRIRKDDLEKAWQIKAIIEKEFYKPYTMTELAQEVGSNKSTMNVAFKKVTGTSLKKFVKELRIQKAKQLLESTGLSIEIIARRIGLHRSNLDIQFKKMTGMTPMQWRMMPGELTSDNKNLFL